MIMGPLHVPCNFGGVINVDAGFYIGAMDEDSGLPVCFLTPTVEKYDKYNRLSDEYSKLLEEEQHLYGDKEYFNKVCSAAIQNGQSCCKNKICVIYKGKMIHINEYQKEAYEDLYYNG